MRDTSPPNKGKHISKRVEGDSNSPEGLGRITETSNQSHNIKAQQVNKLTLFILKKIYYERYTTGLFKRDRY